MKSDTSDFRPMIKKELAEYAEYLVSIRNNFDQDAMELEFKAIASSLSGALNDALSNAVAIVRKAYSPEERRVFPDEQNPHPLDLEFRRQVYQVVANLEPLHAPSPYNYELEDFNY